MITLIACSKSKSSYVGVPEVVYTGFLFKRSLRYARTFKDNRIYILSALYGLLSLDTKIYPYNMDLNTQGVVYRREWGVKVLTSLKEVSDLSNDKFLLLAGKNYIRDLEPYMKYKETPLEGLSFGNHIHRINELIYNVSHGNLREFISINE